MDASLDILAKSYPLLFCFVFLFVGFNWHRQNPTFFIAFWQLLWERITQKVLPKDVNSDQAYIAGGLSLITLLLPIFIILIILYDFAQYAWLLDALILFVATDFAYVNTKTTLSIKAISANKTQLAKDRLQKIVLRNTDNLSLLGIIKANSETFALRFSYQLVTVLTCYLLFGSIFALFYRLIYEAGLGTNYKLIQYKKYVIVCYYLNRLIAYLPVKCFNFVLLMSIVLRRPQAALGILTSRHFWSFEGTSTFATIGGLMNKNIGGPVMLSNNKIRRQRFGGKDAPSTADFKLLKQSLFVSSMLYLTLIYGITVVLF